ncbi:MAG: hypothetical protein LAT63_04990 [Marinobacter sp.]|nr:hypothetical protein [Marinobacter sp.]
MTDTESASPGRSCPLHYRYQPEQLVADPELLTGPGLLVAGGLYGNPYALASLEARWQRESGFELLFNGDFHWFDVEPGCFAEITARVLRHRAQLGNVELELVDPSPGAGCGCAYPESVSSGVVERSNLIMARLQQTLAACDPELAQGLRSLPRWRCLQWQDQRVLVLHGDPESLAGWGLSRDALADPAHQARLRRWFRQTDADLILCTHTCEPALWQQVLDGKLRTVVNNGAAGMGNLMADHRGLATRVALQPAEDAIISLPLSVGVVELVPVSFPLPAWLDLFGTWWPAGSPAELSYAQRIQQGSPLVANNLLVSAPA